METIMLQFTRRIPPLLMAAIRRTRDMSVDSELSGTGDRTPTVQNGIDWLS
jgi:hypothetical protein